MLSVLLYTLKIIGLIILFFVIILLFFILLFFITPLKFKANINYDKKLKVKFKIKWLLGFRYYFNDFEESVIKIFWIDLKKLRKIFRFKLKKFKKINQDIDKLNKKLENNINEENINNEILENKDSNKDTGVNLNFKKKASRKSIEKENSTKTNNNLFGKFKTYINSLNKEILKELFYFIKKVFSSIKIKNLRAFIKYNFEDPFLTGIILGIANIILPFMPYNIEVVSDFQDESFELDFEIEGKVRLFKLIYYTILILFKIKKSIRKNIFYKGEFGDE